MNRPIDRILISQSRHPRRNRRHGSRFAKTPPSLGHRPPLPADAIRPRCAFIAGISTIAGMSTPAETTAVGRSGPVMSVRTVTTIFPAWVRTPCGGEPRRSPSAPAGLPVVGRGEGQVGGIERPQEVRGVEFRRSQPERSWSARTSSMTRRFSPAFPSSPSISATRLIRAFHRAQPRARAHMAGS